MLKDVALRILPRQDLWLQRHLTFDIQKHIWVSFDDSIVEKVAVETKVTEGSKDGHRFAPAGVHINSKIQ